MKNSDRKPEKGFSMEDFNKMLQEELNKRGLDLKVSTKPPKKPENEKKSQEYEIRFFKIYKN